MHTSTACTFICRATFQPGAAAGPLAGAATAPGGCLSRALPFGPIPGCINGCTTQLYHCVVVHLLSILIAHCIAGNKHRPALLQDLWRAQQPPGRLSRALPRLQRLLGRTLVAASLLAVGFVLGQQAQQKWGRQEEHGVPAAAVL